MKNLIQNFFFWPVVVLCIIVLSIVGCDDGVVTISQEEYNHLKENNQLRTVYPKPFKLFDESLGVGDNGIILGSDNHEYLVINHNLNKESTLHYIDCELCKNITLEQQNNVKDTITGVH